MGVGDGWYRLDECDRCLWIDDRTLFGDVLLVLWGYCDGGIKVYELAWWVFLARMGNLECASLTPLYIFCPSISISFPSLSLSLGLCSAYF